jgi:hypothetical protein
LIPALQGGNDRLNVIRFSVPSPGVVKNILPIYLLWRITALCLYLVYSLFVLVPRGCAGTKKGVDCVLVQNPPAMPLLAVVYLYCRYQGLVKGRRPAFVIDWHNLGTKTPASEWRYHWSWPPRCRPLLEFHPS